MDIRVGTGYDSHRLKKNIPLILGGIEIESEFGLVGHSDADVLIHAIMDALLGGAAMRDIGYYFPPSDQKYRGISSLTLLGEVVSLIGEKKYKIINIDSTIICEKPKLSPHIQSMRKKMADFLDIDIDRIGIKATTNERMGFLGRGEGIAAIASVLIGREI
jgi:2-C-methyl-D-erythritol 2,4-cyclodiphosphate synthase